MRTFAVYDASWILRTKLEAADNEQAIRLAKLQGIAAPIVVAELTPDEIKAQRRWQEQAAAHDRLYSGRRQ